MVSGGVLICLFKFGGVLICAGSRMVSGGVDYDVKFWDFQGMDVTRSAFRTLTPHQGYPVHSVAYSSTGDKVLAVTGNLQPKVRLPHPHPAPGLPRAFRRV